MTSSTIARRQCFRISAHRAIGVGNHAQYRGLDQGLTAELLIQFLRRRVQQRRHGHVGFVAGGIDGCQQVLDKFSAARRHFARLLRTMALQFHEGRAHD